MTTAPIAKDYVIATGQTHSLTEFIERPCAMAAVDPAAIIETDPGLFHPTDLKTMPVSPATICRDLGWRVTTGFPELVGKLYQGELF